MTTAVKSRKHSAVRKLEISQLSGREQKLQLMAADLDVARFQIRFADQMKVDIADRIVDAIVERTIEGASKLTVTVNDADRTLLQSGRLHRRQDVEVNGLWFRLYSVSKSGDQLTLDFEDREISILRTYHKKLIASRTKITRAQFIMRMIREVKEFKIPTYIPELEEVQPIEKGTDTPNWAVNFGGTPTSLGIPKKNDLKLKTGSFTEDKRIVANKILDVATSQVLPRQLMVISMMTAIQESTLTNLPRGKPGDYNWLSSDPRENPIGVFQQRYFVNGRRSGWAASGDVTKDATSFFSVLKGIWKNPANRKLPFQELAEMVQHSGNPAGYGTWRTQAERIVTEYGVPPNTSASANAQAGQAAEGGDYHYFRGVPPTKGSKKWKIEDSWTCIQRLAEEVGWRAFFVSGKFYYIKEAELFKTHPLMTLDETTEGVEEIDFDYTRGSKNGQITVQCRMGRWVVPPGSMVTVRNMGPANGRWLVTNVRRSLYDNNGEITLKKPQPALPEPATDQIQTEQSWDWTGQPVQDPEVQRQDMVNAASAAKRILDYQKRGLFRDDNGQQLAQLRKVANGKKLHSQCGTDVKINDKLLNAIVGLLDAGYMLGTFAIVEDHHCNAGQHPRGQAVDISSVGKQKSAGNLDLTGGWGQWYPVNSIHDTRGKTIVKDIMKWLANFGAWDLICNGTGGQADSSIQALQIDNGKPRGGFWETDHLDHIHFGVVPGHQKGST